MRNRKNNNVTPGISVLRGAGIGLFVSLGLYALGFVIEIFNCTCNFLSCKGQWKDALPVMWNTGAFLSCLIICIFGGGLIGWIVSMSNEADVEQRKREIEIAERKKRQQEILQNLQISEEQCKQTLNGLLTYIDPTKAKSAIDYINRQPEVCPDRITRSFAAAQAQNYTDNIEKAFNDAIKEKNYSDALQFVELLYVIYLQSEPLQYKKYERIKENISNLLTFIKKDNISIVSQKYGEENEYFVEKAKQRYRYYFKDLEIDRAVNFSELIWGLALTEPFDIYTYDVFVSQFMKMSENLIIPSDVLATMIYVETKEERKGLEMICPNFNETMSKKLSDSSSNLVISMASVAKWCGNSAVERFCLEIAKRKNFLTSELKERLNEF